MTYAEADRLLQGRCKQSRRIGNNTYLKRDGLAGTNAIHVRLHATNIITFYPDGGFRVSTGGWDTVTTKDRLNSFLPSGWNAWTGGREFGPNTILYHNHIAVAPLSEVVSVSGGKVEGNYDMAQVAKAYRNAVNAGRRERYKERFWILKARRGGKLRKALTLEQIQAEQNVSTRTAMIKIYGIERFLGAINATVLDYLGDYSLIGYSLNAWNHIRALKMVCPSTKTVYIHPVDPQCDTVKRALDWIFQTEDYFDRLAAEA